MFGLFRSARRARPTGESGDQVDTGGGDDSDGGNQLSKHDDFLSKQ